MFAFDGGAPKRLFPTPFYEGWDADEGMVINYRDLTAVRRRAERTAQRLLKCADADALRKEWARASLIADGLHLGQLYREANEIYDAYAVKARVVSPDAEPHPLDMGSAPDSGNATGNTPKEQCAMFAFENGGSQGPWLVWTDQGTKCRTVPPQTFYIREEAGKTVVDLSRGFVMDIHSLRKGWQEGDGRPGVPPVWTLGATPEEMPAQPSKDAKKGFNIRCGLSKTQAVSWDQAGFVPWSAMAHLASGINAGPITDKNKLPLVIHTGVLELKTSRGVFFAPKLEVKGWVARPEILPLNGAISFGDDEPAPQPQRTAAPAPAPAMAEDDFGDFS